MPKIKGKEKINRMKRFENELRENLEVYVGSKWDFEYTLEKIKSLFFNK